MLPNLTAGPSTKAIPPRCQPGHMPRLSFRNALPDDEPDTLTSCSSQNEASNPSDTALSKTTVSLPPSTTNKARPRSSNAALTNGSATAPRTSAPRTSTPMGGPSSKSHPPAKKRQSLFSGLFAKEPSSAALEQLAQKLIAEHGELSPRAIPGVSCATMPKTVPKVNSKWDGRPGATRPKDSRGHESRGTKSRSSASSGRSRSAEPLDRNCPSSRGNRRETWQPRSGSSINRESVATQYSTPPTLAANGDGFHSGTQGYQSANALGKMSRPRSAASRSLRSPSGSSLPEITSFFPHQIPDPPALPSKSRTNSETHATLPTRFKATSLIDSRSQISNASEPTADTSTDYTSLKSVTSSEASPATPLSPCTPIHTINYALYGEDDHSQFSFEQPKPEEVISLPSGKNVLGPPPGPKKKFKPSTMAFLAGEARPFEIPDDSAQDPESRHHQDGLAGPAPPVLSNLARVQQDLEKRPDSSRARLGLRASMLVDTDTLPWQSCRNIANRRSLPHEATASSPKTPTSPKLKPKGFGFFGRDKVEK